MSDTWSLVTDVRLEYATVEVMTGIYGGDFVDGDENRMAVRVCVPGDSDAVILYGTPEELAHFGRRLVERYS